MEPCIAPFKVSKQKRKISEGKIQWNKEHDDYLANLATYYKGKKWNDVSNKMSIKFPGLLVGAKKCRERWLNCANPEVSRTALTEAEELALIMYHHVYRNRWALIAKKIPNRSSTALKNNFYSIIRRHLRIIILKEPGLLTTGTEFLSSLFSSLLIIQLLRLTEPTTPHNEIAPAYIYELIKEKKVTESLCYSYIKKSINEFTSSNMHKPILKKLAEFGTFEKLFELYESLVEFYVGYQNAHELAINEFIVIMLERTLSQRDSLNSEETKAGITSITNPMEENDDFEFGACCSGGTICRKLKVQKTKSCYAVVNSQENKEKAFEYEEMY